MSQLSNEFTKNERIAFAFGIRSIESYLNDVHAASYPQPPEMVGGASYTYFKTAYNDISFKLKTDNSNKHRQAQDIAFKAITDYVIKCKEEGSVKTAAYEHFSNALRTMNHISHEENLEIVKAHIALENRGFVFS